MNFKTPLLGMALITLAASATASTNVIKNGDFESTLSPHWGRVDVSTVTGGLVHQADLATWIWRSASYDKSGIQQSFATVAGQEYLVSFRLHSDAAFTRNSPATFTVTFGGTAADYSVRNEKFGWKEVSFKDKATAATTALKFVAMNYNGGNWRVDNVSVLAVTAPVPEPETYALMLAGLGAVGFVARRRKVA